MREESAAVDSTRPGVDSTRTFIGAAAILKRMNANFGFVDFIFLSVPILLHAQEYDWFLLSTVVLHRCVQWICSMIFLLVKEPFDEFLKCGIVAQMKTNGEEKIIVMHVRYLIRANG